VHTTLSKDGHFFSVHVLEPQAPEERELAAEKASVEASASVPHSDNTDALPASTSHIDLTPNTGNSFFTAFLRPSNVFEALIQVHYIIYHTILQFFLSLFLFV
jgi:hypothetical protein